MENSATALFTVFYAIFCMGFLYQSKEFVGVGLSPENLLSGYLGPGEDVQFVHYHLRRTAGALLLHSLLPVGYALGFGWWSSVDAAAAAAGSPWSSLPSSPLWRAAVAAAVLLPLTAASAVWLWRDGGGWARHPFVRKLKPYCAADDAVPWTQVAADINTEFRRIDKFTIRPSPLSKVVVTDNWVVRLGAWPWSFAVAHQSDIGADGISIDSSDRYGIGVDGDIGGTQFLNISVVSARPGVPPFKFRLNALEYQNLKDKLQGPINNVRNVQIHASTSERFLDVFKRHVAENPRAVHAHELDACIGCMATEANVVLQRRCGTQGQPDSQAACVICYCRPMWCVDCMGKWFASRQNQQEPETWLGSKCPCPTCRSRFCILDVALIQT